MKGVGERRVRRLALKEKDADFGVNMMGFSINPDCF